MTPPATSGAARHGPRRLTLVERLVGLLRLPYPVGSLLISAVMGPPALLRTLRTGDLAATVQGLYPWPAAPPPWLAALAILLWWLQTFLAFWTISFIRSRVVAAEAALAPLLPDGEAGYRRLFAPISRPGPALAVTAGIAAVFAGQALWEFQTALDSFERVYVVVRYASLHLAYGTAIWVYAGSLWGLYRLGRQPLRLKPFYEDRRLGVRPMGTLSLAVSAGYLSNIGAMVLISLVMPVRVEFAATLIAFIVLGVVLFFLPLHAVHGQMAREKDRHEEAIRRRWVESSGLAAAADARPTPTAPDLPGVLADLRDILALQGAERQVGAIATWPFDLQILGGLAALVTAILTGVLTDLITHALGG